MLDSICIVLLAINVAVLVSRVNKIQRQLNEIAKEK